MKNAICINESKGDCALNDARRDRCRTLKQRHEKCETARCPFYKPKNCADWVRVEQGDDVYMLPMEDYRELRGIKDVAEVQEQKEVEKVEYFRI